MRETKPEHAPQGHPAIPPERTGILIANLGTPDGTDYWSMRRYLGQFLSDRRVIDYPPWLWQPLLQLVILSRRPFASGKAYREIWNRERDESPLLTHTRAQAEKLSAALERKAPGKIAVDFCMRYGNPSTESRVERLIAAGCRRILFFPLYPQYSASTTATANDDFFRALAKAKWQPAARTVAPYFDSPLYIEALAGSVKQAYSKLESRPDALVASYHGLPRRYLDLGDPYHCHCRKTSRLLAQKLGWGAESLVTSFQSRFGPEEWLKPYTVEEVARLASAGKRRLAVIAPAFSSDCIETLEEINGEIRESFMEAGGEEFTYIPCLNDEPAHISMLEGIALQNLEGWL